jgi:integrase
MFPLGNDFTTIVYKPKNTHRPYAVRWRIDGRHHERSFATQDQAEAYKAELDYRRRNGSYIDPAKTEQLFRDAVEDWLASAPRTVATLRNYRSVLKRYILPVFGDQTITRVAHNLPQFRQFLLVTLPGKGVGPSTVYTAKLIICATIRDAIATGRLQQSKGAIIFGKGVRIPPVPTRADPYFVTYEELKTLADGMGEPWGLLIWIMRGTGIRLGEALAVKHENFKNGILEVTEQYTAQRKYAPLKHRSAGQSRRVPCPDYVKAMIPKGRGYIFTEPPNRGTLMRRFKKARDAAGLPKDFTFHTLRHIYVSNALAKGVPITDVSRWLGHASIHTTFAIYGHLVDDADGRLRKALDEEYETWRGK